MINFFRKIRYGLMDKDKTGKYFKYAIGEIVLVVIGILIALSINNWNEEQKTRTSEVQILEDMIREIEDDFESFNYNIERHSEAVNSCEALLDIFNKNIGYNDSLSRHFAAIHYYTIFISNMGAYESLKSKGFETISNKELRFEIINLYEKWYPIMQHNDKNLTDDILNIKRNFNQTHFDKFHLFQVTSEGFIYSGEMNPNNFTQLQNDVQFKYFLNSLLSSHSSVVSIYKKVKTKANSIIDESSVEIQKLK